MNKDKVYHTMCRQEDFDTLQTYIDGYMLFTQA